MSIYEQKQKKRYIIFSIRVTKNCDLFGDLISILWPCSRFCFNLPSKSEKMHLRIMVVARKIHEMSMCSRCAVTNICGLFSSNIKRIGCIIITLGTTKIRKTLVDTQKDKAI